jgi:hypothetical protein
MRTTGQAGLFQTAMNSGRDAVTHASDVDANHEHQSGILGGAAPLQIVPASAMTGTETTPGRERYS